ncbi:MAG: c-type cytochrome, partial [Anaerolineae bacterium]|nr:c-type cytochrome [Anaerolineae bacterium]
FMAKCAECHGQRLQGKSGPPIAGPKFLKKVRTLNWSVGDLRGLVVKTMPRSNPGSLSPEQYSEVLAYVLSANCFPAGDQRFPKTDTTKLNHMVIKKLKRSKPNDQNGLCL